MKLFNFLNESFQHYNVRHKPSGKTYRVTAMSQASAKTKAAVQHGGRSASRYSGTSDDQFEIVEGKIKDIVKALKGPGYYSLDKDNPDHPADISDKLRKKLSQKDEGKSPHKKGTKKYKKHMAAMHAGESVTNEAVKPTSIKDLENLHIRRYEYTEIDDMPFIFQTELIGEKLPNESIQDTPDFEYELKMNFEKEGFDRYGKDVTQPYYDGSTLVRPGEIAIGTGEMEGGGTVLYTVVEKDAGMSDQLYPATPPRWPGDDEGNAELHWNPKTNTWSEDVVKEVAGPKDCWDGYKKDGTQPGTGKNKGKRVNKCVKEDESGMIGEPDSYYDAEERTEAYKDLQDILQGNFMDDYIKDGVCPECAGSGYMDGEETFTNDDGEEEESSECDGFGNFGCDEGEMTQNDDGLPNWAEIAKHDERQSEKANRGPAPSQEQIMKVLPRLHDDYVKSGRYNAFELPSILRQMYPELGKRQAGSYVADFFKTFQEQVELRKLAGLEEGPNYDASDIHRGDAITCKQCKGKGCDHCDDKGVHAKSDVKESDSDDVVVAKMLSKALGDPNRWTDMSAPELYAELESTDPETADMIAKVAKMLYDVRLQERTYKDVGVADVQKDPRGKEFKFDKDSKQFKSGDGELADIKTKVGKDLMKKRKLAMKRSTPSYNKKSAPKKKGFIASLFNDIEG